MKILITDKVHELLIEGLIKEGFDVTYDTSVEMEQLPQFLPGLDGIIINSKINMNQAMIDLGKNLKFIARLGSGMEIIDRTYATEKNIVCINTPDGNCDAVAEHVIGMLLSFANNLCKANKEVKNFDWRREENRGFEIGGKTIGIIGMGHTGSALATKLSGFGMTILGHDKFKEDFGHTCQHVEVASKEQIMEECDIISFHLPLAKDTFHYADEQFFAGLKKYPLIINTSRGNVIQTEAIIKALSNKKISGACLDVYENEKPQKYSETEMKKYADLFSHQNVMASPHIAGWTNESLTKIASLTLSRIVKVVKTFDKKS